MDNIKTHTTLQLLLRHQYAGVTIPENDAVAELNRRRWFRPLRFLFLLFVIPLIFPERLCNNIDMGDPWESASLKTLIFSALFSIWSVAPFVCAGSLILTFFSSIKGESVSFLLAAYSAGAFVILSGILWFSRGKWG
jgi:hypothetical protein